jgi:hypothetical protein
VGKGLLSGAVDLVKDLSQLHSSGPIKSVKTNQRTIRRTVSKKFQLHSPLSYAMADFALSECNQGLGPNIRTES